MAKLSVASPAGRVYRFTPYRLYHISKTTSLDPSSSTSVSSPPTASPPPPTPCKTRLVDEMFTSDCWLRADQEIQSKIVPDDGGEERAIFGLVLFSDATKPVQFGPAHLWPLYSATSNNPKWYRSRPKSRGFELMGFFLKVSRFLRTLFCMSSQPNSCHRLHKR